MTASTLSRRSLLKLGAGAVIAGEERLTYARIGVPQENERPLQSPTGQSDRPPLRTRGLFLYVWDLAAGGPSPSGPSRLALAGATGVYVQGFYGLTLAFDAASGKELWRANLGGSLQSTPIVTEEAVYIATYPGVRYALR